MENLTLEEAPPQGAAGGAQMHLLGPGIPPPNQQLPPQMFTTAAQLLDMTDSKDFFVVTSQRPLERRVPLLAVVRVNCILSQNLSRLLQMIYLLYIHPANGKDS